MDDFSSDCKITVLEISREDLDNKNENGNLVSPKEIVE